MDALENRSNVHGTVLGIDGGLMIRGLVWTRRVSVGCCVVRGKMKAVLCSGGVLVDLER